MFSFVSEVLSHGKWPEDPLRGSGANDRQMAREAVLLTEMTRNSA